MTDCTADEPEARLVRRAACYVSTTCADALAKTLSELYDDASRGKDVCAHADALRFHLRAEGAVPWGHAEPLRQAVERIADLAEAADREALAARLTTVMGALRSARAARQMPPPRFLRERGPGGGWTASTARSAPFGTRMASTPAASERIDAATIQAIVQEVQSLAEWKVMKPPARLKLAQELGPKFDNSVAWSEAMAKRVQGATAEAVRTWYRRKLNDSAKESIDGGRWPKQKR